MAQASPGAASIQFQLGMLALELGRTTEAMAAFTQAATTRPSDAELAMAMAEALIAANRPADATVQADTAVMLAEAEPMSDLAARAHATATLVALASGNTDAATMHAATVDQIRGGHAWAAYVQGRTAFVAEQNDAALTALQDAAKEAASLDMAVPDLHLFLGHTLTRLMQYDQAEMEYRKALQQFPHALAPYEGLASLYQAADRRAEIDMLVDEVLRTHPTVVGTASAIRMWTIAGDRRKADGLRNDARRRFRGDPALALLGRGR
jgi:tetratricopeptide (TPR) repeat protein